MGTPKVLKAVWVGHGTRKIASSRAFRHFGIFKVGHFPMWGLMAQVEHTRLYFEIGAASATENDTDDVYLDIPAALTAVNRKQYHQFTAKGDPLCYTVTITNVKSSKPLVVTTAPNTWTTENAARKTAVGWKKQLKKGGIRMSEMPTYAQRFRCAFDLNAVSTGNSQAILKQLVPDGAPVAGESHGARLFTDYSSPDGGTISYSTSNEVSFLPVSEVDAADPYKPVLCGDTAGGTEIFGMIYEYLKSRRNMREASDPLTEFPDTDGLMNTLFAESEMLADEVTKAAEDYNTNRPYTEANADEPVWGATVESGTTNYRETFSVPLGLLKITGAFGLGVGDMFCIDVEAVYEM